MLKNKKAYFQGGGKSNEPTPKKKKYKSEEAIVAQPRLQEPFYQNYDLYDISGKHGPGSGAYRMDKHKTIQEYLINKRKKLKDKYKAKDSWISKDFDNHKDRVKRIKIRTSLFSQIIKNAIDFPIDDQIKSGPIDNKGAYDGADGIYESTVKLDGLLDEYLPHNDFEGKSVDKLNFGRDYTDIEPNRNIHDLLTIFLNKYYNPKEPELLGLSNGFDPEEELDPNYTLNDFNPEYGTTDSGNLIYSNM